MLTNGRSIHRIQTSDEIRRNRWLHLFSTDALPIIGTAPRWQEQQGRGFPVLAYDLALAELSHAQRARFAGYLSRKYGLEYTAVLAELETAVSFRKNGDMLMVGVIPE